LQSAHSEYTRELGTTVGEGPYKGHEIGAHKIQSVFIPMNKELTTIYDARP